MNISCFSKENLLVEIPISLKGTSSNLFFKREIATWYKSSAKMVGSLKVCVLVIILKLWRLSLIVKDLASMFFFLKFLILLQLKSTKFFLIFLDQKRQSQK